MREVFVNTRTRLKIQAMVQEHLTMSGASSARERASDLDAFITKQTSGSRRTKGLRGSDIVLDRASGLDLDDLFILYRSGLLISSFTTDVDDGLDRDVLGSMMMAISEFVQSSFKPSGTWGRKARLTSIQLEDREIAFEHGEFLVVAMVRSGSLPSSTKDRVSKALKKVEVNNRVRLETWNGDLGKLDDMVREFVDSLSE